MPIFGTKNGEHLSRSGQSSPMNAAEDATLWQSFKSGNELAFSVLYRRHVQRLYNYGMHACGDKELVNDCLQELFARLWDRRGTLGTAGSVNYYLFKSFRRILIRRIVSGKRFTSPSNSQSDTVFEFIPSYEEHLTEAETRLQRHENLTHAIQSLTKRQREAVFLKFFNEMSYQEVAAIMEVQVDSLYNLISKAIETLRSEMKKTSL